MIISAIELIGYKRFRLNNVRRIALTLSEINQVILGTNGCGKSSLMYELSPLPASPADFHKEGSKTITIIDGQDTYVLKSWFSPSQRHSFKKNDVELNGTDGGTAAQQKDLVREHFGITNEIREMLTGRVRFTEMTPSDRRKWLMLLSEMDYEYALGVYNKFKKEVTHYEGALKHAKKRLVAETEKMISKAEQDVLANEVNQIHRELNMLMEQRAPVTNPSAFYKNAVDAKLQELQGMSNKLLRMRFVTPYTYHRNHLERDEWGQLIRPHYTSSEQVDAVITELRTEIIAKETLLNNCVQQHKKALAQLEVLTKTGEATVAALVEQRSKSYEEEQWLLDLRHLKLEDISAREGIAAVEFLFEPLTALLTEIPSNIDGVYGQVKMQAAETEAIALREKIRHAEHHLKQKVAAKDHMEQHQGNQETECPKCQHRWNLRYDAKKHNELLEDISKLDIELGELRRGLEKQETLYETNRVYGEQFRSFHRLARAWPALNPFWEYVTDKKYLAENPRQILVTLSRFLEDLNHELAAEKIREERRDLMKLIQAKEEAGDQSIASVRAEVEEHTLLIEELTSTLTTLQMSVSEHLTFKRQLTEMLQLSEKIEQLRNDAQNTQNEMIEMLRREMLQQCIRQLQSALSRKEEAYAYITMQAGLVEDLKNQVLELEKRELAAKTLMRELSPTDGLIADGLLGFISSFLKQINNQIRKVWVYRLEVLTCQSEESTTAELDYKFPMIVDSPDNLVPDIKFGSEGQREIIDLAFRIASMKCLNLLRGPLYLDEFGSRMDPGHKFETVNYIGTLCQSLPFTQIFLVSHDYSQYISLPAVQFAVISPTNITLPPNYNEHVEIE